MKTVLNFRTASAPIFYGGSKGTLRSRPAPPRPRLLVLDDDEDIREIYVQVLAQNGYEVDAAADGEAGWEALQVRHYDLLVTDHIMPNMTGLELVKKVGASGLSLAIVFASGSLSPVELQRQSPIPIAAALPKPFSPEELVKTVQRVLRERDVAGLANTSRAAA